MGSGEGSAERVAVGLRPRVAVGSAPVTEVEGSAGEQVGRTAPGGDAGPFTVLYVEDHPINIDLVRRLVARRPSMRLQIARTGAQALCLVKLGPPDLVLLDLDLPDASGEVVLERLWALPGCAEVPVVVLSADAVADTATRLLALGVTEFLTKPLDVARFYACLDAIAAVPLALPLPRQGGGTGRVS